jgi:hypothetical protein
LNVATKNDVEAAFVSGLARLAKWADNPSPTWKRPEVSALLAASIAARAAMAAIHAGDIRATALHCHICGYWQGMSVPEFLKERAVQAMLRGKLEAFESGEYSPYNRIFDDDTKREAVKMFNKLLAQHKKDDTAKPTEMATRKVCERVGCSSRSLRYWRKSLATL